MVTLHRLRADPAGTINAVSTTCAHRGAQLTNGWIDEVNGTSCVRCPYHSWAFSGDGTLKHVPSEPDGRFPKRPLQEPFDLREKDGHIWMYWGNPRIPSSVRAPVPGSMIPEPVRPRFRPYHQCPVVACVQATCLEMKHITYQRSAAGLRWLDSGCTQQMT